MLCLSSLQIAIMLHEMRQASSFNALMITTIPATIALWLLMHLLKGRALCSPHPLCSLNSITSTWQMGRKKRLREVGGSGWGHTSRKWKSGDLNLGLRIPGTVAGRTLLWHLSSRSFSGKSTSSTSPVWGQMIVKLTNMGPEISTEDWTVSGRVYGHHPRQIHLLCTLKCVETAHDEVGLSLRHLILAELLL